ncbi:MAG: DegV family protein [Anaerolineae bacterium]
MFLLLGEGGGTFNAARLATQRFSEAIRVVDSLSLSLGLGLQALLAAQAARAGRSVQELLALLEDLQARMHLMIVLDTLENLLQVSCISAKIPPEAVARAIVRAIHRSSCLGGWIMHLFHLEDRENIIVEWELLLRLDAVLGERALVE